MVHKYTFTYSQVRNIDIKLDLYLPEQKNANSEPTDASVSGSQTLISIPSLVFFHGGGLTAGNRELLPDLLRDEVLAASFAFISADYRLLFPFSARHIHQDVINLFKFLSNSLNKELLAQNPTNPPPYLISEKIFTVAGASAGAYPARLAALYASPRPCAIFSLYGIGGDLLSPFYVHQAPMTGWESNLGNNKIFLAPTAKDKESLLPGISECPMEVDPDIPNPAIPGHYERVRTLYVKMLESGTYLDHLMDYPGLGEMLLQAGMKDQRVDSSSSTSSSGSNSSSTEAQRKKKQKMEAAIPQEIRYLFPQLNIDSSFPPTYLVHGTNDKAVDCRESKEMAKRLCELGVKCEIVLAGGLGHAFDLPKVSGALGRVLWERYLGEVVPFLQKCVRMHKEKE
ncbi:Alpha/Beta hydrolase protein [Kalaharituber pfeilii]|nr:Alpha/Beta hydrolase protein [Kalaharituber pfeilii]